MMIVERQLENAIIGEIAKLGLGDGVRVVGSWSVANDGELKGYGDETGAVLAVAVAPRSYDGFMSQQADFACSIVLSVRRDVHPTGAEIAEYTEPLFALLDTWNRNEDAIYADLQTDDFQPGGLQLNGGDGPVYDDATSIWTVTQTFTIRGIIR